MHKGHRVCSFSLLEFAALLAAAGPCPPTLPAQTLNIRPPWPSSLFALVRPTALDLLGLSLPCLTLNMVGSRCAWQAPYISVILYTPWLQNLSVPTCTQGEHLQLAPGASWLLGVGAEAVGHSLPYGLMGEWREMCAIMAAVENSGKWWSKTSEYWVEIVLWELFIS